MNGEQQKTLSDDANQFTNLIGKKAGRFISQGQPVTLQVSNPDGLRSPEFQFTRR